MTGVVLMSPEMLSTGRAAKLCSVTPDTVLKWIKKDQIQAVKTPGGHYRICKAQLEPYMSGEARDDVASTESAQAPITYCWDYHADNGHISDSCRECMVLKSKAEKCYLMAELGKVIGHAQTFCQKGCDECDYLKFVNKKTGNPQ